MDLDFIFQVFQINEMLFWGILFTIFLIAEAVTTALVSVWFVLGSVVAFIAASCDAPFWLQLLLFVVSSFLFLLATRPFIKRMKIAKPSTDTDPIVGTQGIVLQQINNTYNKGRVFAKGLDWQARSTDGSVLEKDEPVIVDRQENLTLYVSRLMNASSANE